MDESTLIVLRIVLRIVSVAVCITRANHLHRSKLGWGVLGFIFPIPAMIIIAFMKVNRKWEESPKIDE